MVTLPFYQLDDGGRGVRRRNFDRVSASELGRKEDRHLRTRRWRDRHRQEGEKKKLVLICSTLVNFIPHFITNVFFASCLRLAKLTKIWLLLEAKLRGTVTVQLPMPLPSKPGKISLWKNRLRRFTGRKVQTKSKTTPRILASKKPLWCLKFAKS